ncbi:MAG: hypothetical protein WC710_11935 [Gallionella sp.]
MQQVHGRFGIDIMSTAIKNRMSMYAGLLALSLILLQSGFSYYFSYQMLALVLVGLIIYSARPTLINVRYQFIVLMLLSLFIIATAIISPMVVSRNATNIMGTVVGILAFASMILCLQNIRFLRVEKVLWLLKYSTAMVVVILSALLVLTDMSFIPGLNRQNLLLQNTSLVTNFASEEMLENELAFREAENINPRVDLFYGEPSFLAVVIFTCALSYLLVLRLASIKKLIDLGHPISQPIFLMTKYQKTVLSLAIFSLVYLLSLSSLIYAVILAYAAFRGKKGMSIHGFRKILFFLIFSLVFIGYGSDYLMHRIFTIEDSISLFQRFGSLFEFGFKEYLFGLHELGMIPEEGFHNGLIYIVAISGGAGILYIYSLLRTGIRLSRYLELSSAVFLSVLALTMQNGAVFSPNKVVLFALIFLPLSCARSILRDVAER